MTPDSADGSDGFDNGLGSGNDPPNDPGRDPDLGALLGRLARSMGAGGLELGGENVRFEQAPEEGLEVRLTLNDDAGEPASIASMLLPSPSRPPAHPADVPFVPNASLRVIEDRLRHVLLAMWILGDAGPPVDRALASVLRSSREAGWRLEDPAGTPEPGPYRLLRGDEVRRVEATEGHAGPVVSLSQKRVVPDVGIDRSRP